MTRAKPVDAGCFNRQLTIENEIEAADGYGGFTKSYQSEDAVWARICPVSATARIKADADINEVTHKLVMRFNAAITATSRFVSGSRRFYVETIKDPDETRRYLECMVVERS